MNGKKNLIIYKNTILSLQLKSTNIPTRLDVMKEANHSKHNEIKV